MCAKKQKVEMHANAHTWQAGDSAVLVTVVAGEDPQGAAMHIVPYELVHELLQAAIDCNAPNPDGAMPRLSLRMDEEGGMDQLFEILQTSVPILRYQAWAKGSSAQGHPRWCATATSEAADDQGDDAGDVASEGKDNELGDVLKAKIEMEIADWASVICGYKSETQKPPNVAVKIVGHVVLANE